MAQKRMFDKAIIDTDRFMDLPMSAKALYFLLGMEADDEGFVSYKKVMRIHGGNEDEVKILLAKNFLIMFPSGVVVITDWNQNNYLDKNRIKETEYQNEKKMLLLTNKNRYELNNGLTRVEESSIEQIEDSLKILDSLSEEVLKEMTTKFKCEDSEVRTKARALADYCRSKGKRYKNYKALLSNALRKDFGERPPSRKVEIRDGVAHIIN